MEIVLITNGYLYDEELTALFQKHRVGVCISFDGAEKHQNVTRLTRGTHQPTFKRVVKNYKRYQNAGLSMGVSTALGRHNVFDLLEICDFYASELKPPFVEFQIPYQVAGESNEFYVTTEEVAPRLMEAYAYLQSKNVIEGTTYRRLRDFSLGRVRFRDCGASASQLVVAPDGMIGPCHSLVGTRTYFSGNVTDPESDPRKLDNFTEWARRIPFNMPQCHHCPYISLCGGGCIYNSQVTSGTIWEKDPQVCTYMEEMVDWILRDLWVDTGMSSKHGITQKVIA